MSLDFIKFINSNSSLSDIEQTTMLDDFCAQYGFVENLNDEENPTITKAEYFNRKVSEFIEGTVYVQRKKQEDRKIVVNRLILLPLKSTNDIGGIQVSPVDAIDQ
jgi:hypothetical protein